MMSQASIALVAYDDGWPRKFNNERKVLQKVAGNWLCGSIEHVGSTAVPGMIAKPIIDIMFGVQSLKVSEPAIEKLVESGYKYWPYKADVMHWFCKPSDAFRTHHLHLVPFESPLWHERIAFRDLLRADQDVANQYAHLKLALARQHSTDREKYTAEKWPFIEKMLTRHNASKND